MEDQLPTTIKENAAQLKTFHESLASHKRQEAYFKCLIGRNLIRLKQVSGKKGAKLVEFVQQFLPRYFGRSDIYFMMELHKLADVYKKLMYVTVGTGILKNRFKTVKWLMEDEPEFWQDID